MFPAFRHPHARLAVVAAAVAILAGATLAQTPPASSKLIAELPGTMES